MISILGQDKNLGTTVLSSKRKLFSVLSLKSHRNQCESQFRGTLFGNKFNPLLWEQSAVSSTPRDRATAVF